jgi:hypothetical protein
MIRFFKAQDRQVCTEGATSSYLNAREQALCHRSRQHRSRRYAGRDSLKTTSDK